MKLKIILITGMLGLVLGSYHLSAQITIWHEDFSSYPNGSMVPADNNLPFGPDWIVGACVSCASDPGDWWEIRSNRMEARDVNNETPFLRTEVIDISGFSSVSFSVLVTETGDHEGIYLNSLSCIDEDNEDFADVSFRLDGGPWLKIINYLNWCGLYGSCAMHTLMGDEGSAVDCRSSDEDWVSATVSVGGLSGSTLEILLEARNSAASEYIQFDNVRVEGFLLLPVELLSFKAELEGESVLLSWTTLSEINNDYFELQRSADMNNWQSIDRVKGSGTTIRRQDYSLRDRPNSEGRMQEIWYYRLLQVDYNGDEELSKVVAIEMNTSFSQREFSLFPNPAANEVRLQFSADKADIALIRILDLSGKLRFSYSYSVQPGLNNALVDLSDLIQGYYFIELILNDRSETARLLKQ